MKYNKTSKKIIKDLKWYKEILEENFNDLEDRIKYFNNKMPRIIYILPINFDYKVNANMIFDSNSEKKRIEIIKSFSNEKDIIYSNDLDLFDDGIHLSYKGHQQMAKLVEEVICED
jgi:lysophospholipase L1-like esterase